MILAVVFISMVAVVGAYLFYRHQCRLRDRAHLMREAIRNEDFTFHLPVQGLFFGERALQELLNELGQEIHQLVVRNEVESWQRLTRVLTHEIMNATAPIQSITQAYLANPKIQGSPYEEGIRAIHDTSAGLAHFVESYRKLTQLQEPIVTELSLLDFARSLQPLYPDLTWQIDLPASRCWKADASLLRQALINLIKNAKEAGAHTLDLRWREGLLVSNDGQPIPASLRREIFVPFFTTKRSGSGIGLSLARQILLRQGIDLSLLDTPVSGFHVSFRLQSAYPTC